LEFKTDSIIGKQQPNLFLLIQRLKGEGELVHWQTENKGTWKA